MSSANDFIKVWVKIDMVTVCLHFPYLLIIEILRSEHSGHAHGHGHGEEEKSKGHSHGGEEKTHGHEGGERTHGHDH